MIINLSPYRTDEIVSFEKYDEAIVINGEVFDFSPIGDGDTLPNSAIFSQWFDADVFKENGILNVTLILPLPANWSQEQAFPQPIIDPPNGPLVLPEPLPPVEFDSEVPE